MRTPNNDDNSVFAFNLHMCSGGTAVYSTYTHWVGFGNDHRDIRAPSVLRRDVFGGMLLKLGQQPALVRSDEDYQLWLQRTGWALVPEKTAYDLTPFWLKQHECVKGRNGVYTAVSLSAKSATKHRVHRSKRTKVLSRDGARCLDCGATEEDGAKLTMHHVEAFSRGRETITQNLATLCEECNQKRADRGTASDFDVAAAISDFDLSLLGSRLSAGYVVAAFKISNNLMRASVEVY